MKMKQERKTCISIKKICVFLLAFTMLFLLAACTPGALKGNKAAVIELTSDMIVAGGQINDAVFSAIADGEELQVKVMWEDVSGDETFEKSSDYTVEVEITTPANFDDGKTTLDFMGDYGTVESFGIKATYQDEKVFSALIRYEIPGDEMAEGSKLVVDVEYPEEGQIINGGDYKATVTEVDKDGNVVSERDVYQVLWEGDNVDFDNPEQKFEAGMTYTVRINFDGYSNWDVDDAMMLIDAPEIIVNDGYVYKYTQVFAMTNYGISFDYTLDYNVAKLAVDIEYPKAGEKIKRDDIFASVKALDDKGNVVSERGVFLTFWEGDNVNDDPNQLFEVGKTYSVRINFEGYSVWNTDDNMSVIDYPELVVSEGFTFNYLCVYAMNTCGFSFDYTIPKDEKEETTEKKTEKKTEKVTEAPTEAATEAPAGDTTVEKTEASTEKTEASTEKKTEAKTEAKTEKTTEKTTEAPVHTHKYVKFTPSEAAAGHYGTCSCGEKVLLPHQGTLLDTSEPTCSEKGGEYYECKDCGEVYEVTIPINPKNHCWEYQGEDAKERVCAFCGISESQAK